MTAWLQADIPFGILIMFSGRDVSDHVPHLVVPPLTITSRARAAPARTRNLRNFPRHHRFLQRPARNDAQVGITA